ncbi:MAG: 6-phosphogluconolactonase [Saprospiraceae bacterium]
MQLHIFKTPQEAVVALADFFIAQAQAAIAERDECNVALSGGRSPQALHALLASPAYREQIDWKKVYFFFGDERYVPATDPENNAHMAREAMLDPLQLPPFQIFPVDTSFPPAEAARHYTEVIDRHFKGEKARFDLILLGLGDNAHTASLFPHSPVLEDRSASVKSLFVEELDSYRITMTAPMINQARQVAFLVFGASKAPALQQILKGKRDQQQFPAQLIRPIPGELHWFLDAAAASQLNGGGAN